MLYRFLINIIKKIPLYYKIKFLILELLRIISTTCIYNWVYVKFFESINNDKSIKYMLLMGLTYISINYINLLYENNKEYFIKLFKQIFLRDSLVRLSKKDKLDNINEYKLECIIDKAKDNLVLLFENSLNLFFKIINLCMILYYAKKISINIIFSVFIINLLFYKFYGNNKTNQLYEERNMINKKLTMYNIKLKKSYEKKNINNILKNYTYLHFLDTELNKNNRIYNFWNTLLADMCIVFGTIYFLYNKNMNHVMPLIASLRNCCNFLTFCISFYNSFLKIVSNFNEYLEII